jgi:hypothetical protein
MKGCVVKKHRYFGHECIKIIIMSGKTNIRRSGKGIKKKHSRRVFLASWRSFSDQFY